jgi:K(+)-stimulated pyrophosphate-energized sodium pump
MNLVSLLIAPSVVRYGVGPHHSTAVRTVTTVLAVLILVSVIVYSKRRAVPATAGSSEPERERAHV